MLISLALCRDVGVADDDPEALEKEEEVMAILHSRIHQHHLPIIALGSGRGALRDKYLAILHAMIVEAGASMKGLQRFTSNICVGTFDLGVEFALNTVKEESIRDLFP